MSWTAIPAELRETPHWLVWRYEPVPGRKKPTKVPYDATRPGIHAKSTDAATWAPFDVAIAAASDFDGIRFALDGTGLVGLDFDGVIDEDEIHPAALEAVHALQAYRDAEDLLERYPKLAGIARRQGRAPGGDGTPSAWDWYLACEARRKRLSEDEAIAIRSRSTPARRG